MSALDGLAVALLPQLSPSGTLAEIAATANPDLDAVLDRFDAHEQAIRQLAQPGLVSRLEDDFAACVPALSDAAIPLETWAIPLLSALAGPAAPLLSFGLQVACKVALAVLKSWAAKRLAAKASQTGVSP